MKAETAVIGKARKQVRQGRCVPHEDVAKWLLSWGTEQKRRAPRPKVTSR